jgi:hypothetical protein
MEEKDALVVKLKESVKTLKEKFQQKNENADLMSFYEQQLVEKDQLISVTI